MTTRATFLRLLTALLATMSLLTGCAMPAPTETGTFVALEVP